MSPSFAAITTSATVPDAGPAVVSGDFTGWRKSSRSNSGACVEVGSWRKPRRSGGTGACVEVGHGPAVIGVRDSQDPDGAMLVFDGEAWAAFTASLEGPRDRNRPPPERMKPYLRDVLP